MTTRATGDKKPKQHLRPVSTLYYSSKHGKLMLSDVCPHRRKISQCPRFFCTQAVEKFQWLELLRTKARQTEEIIEEAESLLKSKLIQTYTTSLEQLDAFNSEQVEALKQKLLKRGSKENLVRQNLKFIKFFDLDKKDLEETDSPLCFTKDHVDFVSNLHDVLREHRVARCRMLADKQRYLHQCEMVDMRESISKPLEIIEQMSDHHLSTVRFQTARLEKLLLYILRCCLDPRYGHSSTNLVDNQIVVERVRQTSTRTFQMLKSVLETFRTICEEVRRIHCSGDKEIEKIIGSTSHIANEMISTVVNDSSDLEVPISECTKVSEKPRTSLSPTVSRSNPSSSQVNSGTGTLKLSVRLSDTRLDDKRKLRSILSGSNLRDDSDDADNKSMSWNRQPCIFCKKKFRGAGKAAPSIVHRDDDVRQRARAEVDKEVSLFADFEKKVTIGPGYSEKRKELLKDLGNTTNVGDVSTVPVFCSWVCVKRWTVRCCPIQYKYQSEMLIDMVAGYAVPM